jgi:Kef-type K+ transport system membrane component KefB
VSTDALVTHVMASAAVIFGFAFIGGRLSRRLGQPEVIGQVIAGITLGPAVLGKLSGRLSQMLVPPAVQPVLTVLGQLAVVLFLFVVGFELDLVDLRKKQRVVRVVACSAFVLPMLLGAGAGLLLAFRYLPGSASVHQRVGFMLFIAVALSITAVPVLAAILRECGLLNHPAATVSLAAAGIIDALSWLVLAASVLISTEAQSSWDFFDHTLLLLMFYLLAMVCCIRPILSRLLRNGPVENLMMPIAVVIALGSASVTSALGLHSVFGAFLAGLLMPRTTNRAAQLKLMEPLQHTGTLLLPQFFVVAGFPVSFTGLAGKDLIVLALVCLLAVTGKLGGGLLGARLARLSPRQSAMIGVLLNTRGLTELIALNVGVQTAIIDQRLYTVLVIMALATTVCTPALLRRVHTPVAPPASLPTHDGPCPALPQPHRKTPRLNRRLVPNERTCRSAARICIGRIASIRRRLAPNRRSLPGNGDRDGPGW